jgi:hypothetical protein
MERERIKGREKTREKKRKKEKGREREKKFITQGKRGEA